jgi:hypothetical protein
MEGVGHGEDGLERVALRAARRGGVGLIARDSDVVVKDVLDGLGGNAWPVVGHLDALVIDGDGYLGRGARSLAGVERIVDELLEDDQWSRPSAPRCAGRQGP